MVPYYENRIADENAYQEGGTRQGRMQPTSPGQQHWASILTQAAVAETHGFWDWSTPHPTSRLHSCTASSSIVRLELMMCATRGCWFSHPLNHRLGRRGTILISAFFCLGSVIGSAFTQTWPQLFICRLLLGIGMGTKASTIPVFAAENSPASIRGSLVMGWQLWVAFGIFL